ncbi:MAG: hypothetical protein ACI8XO_003592 [Verrucomicrobiales bacterium]
MEEIGKGDPQQAVSLLERLDAKSASAVEAVVVEALAREDLTTALDWLGAREMLPGREGVGDRLESFRRLTPALAGLPLQEAVAVYDRFFPDAENKLQKRTYSDGRVEFYLGDPALPATDFLAQHLGREVELGKELLALPPSAARDQLVAAAMGLWAKIDPAGAADVVLALDGESFERIAGSLAYPLGNQAPARGLALASRLSGESQEGFLQVLTQMVVLGEAPRPVAFTR